MWRMLKKLILRPFFYVFAGLKYLCLSYELFVLSIMQEDVHTLRERSCSVCKSSFRLVYHDE